MAESYQPSFLVRYLDEDISSIIPECKIVVNLSEDVKMPGELTRLGKELVHQTVKAISGHLHIAE